MPYYLTGDYYKGDYYRHRGDPGLFSFLGGIVKGALSIGKGIVTGGPIGGISAAAGLLAPRPGMTGSGLPAPRGPGGLILPGGIGVHPMSVLPGGKPFITRQGGATRPGYHLDKKTGTYEVRNRSMNPANPRALRRAVRREHGFVALARRVLRGTGISIGRRSFARKGVRKR